VTTPRFPVHVSPEAAANMRAASRSGVADIAAALDALERSGPSGIDVHRKGSEWSGRVTAGDYVLTVAGRDGDPRIVVVQIDLVEQHAAQRVVEVLPLRYTTRRTLGGLLQGIDVDLRYTLRTLRRSPVFTAVVVLTLAIGLGGTTALMDVVHTVYRHALPFGDGDRLVRVRNTNTSPSGETRAYNLTPGDFELVRDQNRTFTSVVAMAGRSLSLTGDGPAERVSAIGVSPNWTQTLRLSPMLGRTFSPDEERAGSDAGVALISHSLWQRRFGADSSVLGQQLRFDGGTLVIIGVMPPRINYPYDAAVWTPWTFPQGSAASSLNVVARLRDDASLETARVDAAQLQAARVAAASNRSATGFEITTSRSDFIRDDGRTLQVLSAAVLFLLVLACVNVANLLVARFTTRRAELGLRAALGGRRDQQMRQMMLEAVILFGAGALGGVLLGQWLRMLLSVTVPLVFRNQLGFGSGGVGSGVAAVTLALAVVCGLGVGVVAALRAIRVDPMTLVRQGGRGTVARADRRLFDALVAAQLSLSLVLLVGASLLIGRFVQLNSTDPGYDVTGVSTMRITVEQERYRAPDARHRLVQTLEERLSAVPGVSAVGITTVNPICCGDWGAPIEVEGRPVQPGEPATLVAHSYVSPGYFAAMNIRLLRGSGYERSDRPDGPLTVVIDEPFARMAWPGEDPIGKRVKIARPNQEWRTVVGVVPVTEHDAEMRASWFLPYLQDPTGSSTEQLHIMVKESRSVPMELLRDVIREIDPGLAVYGMTTMETLWSERSSQDRLGAIVAAVFAAFGLLLAGFSLYGLLSYSVELRAAEMGVRMALGASRGEIVWLVVKQAAARLSAGLAIGLALAVGANQVLRSMVDGLEWVPWPTLLGLAALMAVVSAIAAMVPALRATRVDPIRALRAS
jgi:putative ABC transport system permease protein